MVLRTLLWANIVIYELQAIGQICSGNSMDKNLEQCVKLAERAAAAGAKVSFSSSVVSCFVLDFFEGGGVLSQCLAVTTLALCLVFRR